MDMKTDVDAAPVQPIVTMPFAPYYDSDGVTIYNADCRKVLPWIEPVDLLLTDPPYGIGESSKVAKRATDGVSRPGGAPKFFEASDWDNSTPPRWLMDMANENATNAILWGGNYYGLPASSCWLVWDKDNGTTDFADCELAWTNMPKAVRKFKWRWNGMLQEHGGDKKENRVHPTQKPLALMRWCLSLVPDAETVLDPFAGSGTTLVAARLEGRKAIGIEINEKYCEAAANRLAQRTLF
jgi:DNA modification methylase